MTTEKSEKPFIDAEDAADHRRLSIFTSQADVKLALDAGFTEDEVAFMLDLREPAPGAKVDGEDLAPDAADEIRIAK